MAQSLEAVLSASRHRRVAPALAPRLALTIRMSLPRLRLTAVCLVDSFVYFTFSKRLTHPAWTDNIEQTRWNNSLLCCEQTRWNDLLLCCDLGPNSACFHLCLDMIH